MDIVSKKITYLSKFMNTGIISILILRIIEARLRPFVQTSTHKRSRIVPFLTGITSLGVNVPTVIYIREIVPRSISLFRRGTFYCARDVGIMQQRVAPVHRVGFIELPGSSSWRKKYSIYPEPSSFRIVPLSNFVSLSELPLSIGQMLLPFWQDRKFSLIRVFRYGSTFLSWRKFTILSKAI